MLYLLFAFTALLFGACIGYVLGALMAYNKTSLYEPPDVRVAILPCTCFVMKGETDNIGQVHGSIILDSGCPYHGNTAQHSAKIYSECQKN